jgi:predicted Zn-dependent protease
LTRLEGPGAAGAGHDPADAKNWEEVEDAVEALHDEQPIEAIVALRAVIKQNPRNPYAFHYLGVSLFETAELEAARDAYRAALALAPQYLGARIHLSHVLRMLRDVRGAVEQGEIAKRQAPNDPDVWHALGMAHAQRGDKEMARQLLEAYLRSNPEFEVGMEVRAILHQFGPAPEPSDEDD